MFCPKCRAEYKEGVKECGQCEASLVAVLPEKPERAEQKDIDFVSVVRTFLPADIAIIESILADTDIEYYIQGKEGMVTYPLVDPGNVMVVKEQAEEARELLKDLKLQFYVSCHDEEEKPDDESSK